MGSARTASPRAAVMGGARCAGRGGASGGPRDGRWARRWLERIAVGAVCVLIAAYRVTLGTQLIGSCRFEPSCSRYAEEALRRFGLVQGGWLTLKWLGRCRPLGKSGWDPVPE